MYIRLNALLSSIDRLYLTKGFFIIKKNTVGSRSWYYWKKAATLFITLHALHAYNSTILEVKIPFPWFVEAALVRCGLLSLSLSIALSDTVYSSQGIDGSFTTLCRGGRSKCS